jgi:hypothetical protein
MKNILMLMMIVVISTVQAQTLFDLIPTRKIEDAKIKELANTSNDAFVMLKELYPDLFRENINLDSLEQTGKFLWTLPSGFGRFALIMKAIGNEYEGKGFYLNPAFEWSIIDKYGQKYLIPRQ